MTDSTPTGFRPTWQRVLFHGLGAAGLVGALVLALMGKGLLEFFTSSCGDEAGGGDLERLRRGIVILAAGAASVPAVVAAVARWRGFAWKPWACVACGIVVLGLVRAATTSEVGSWCLY